MTAGDRAHQQWLFDFFDVISTEGGNFQLLVGPQDLTLLNQTLTSFSVIHNNVQNLIDFETNSSHEGINNAEILDAGPETWVSMYRTYNETQLWYSQLAETFPDTTYIESIGKVFNDPPFFLFFFCKHVAAGQVSRLKRS